MGPWASTQQLILSCLIGCVVLGRWWCQPAPATQGLHACQQVQQQVAAPCSSGCTVVCHFLGACPGVFKGHPPGPHPFRPQGIQIFYSQHQIPDTLDSMASFHPYYGGRTPQTLHKNSGKKGGAWGEGEQQIPPRVGLHLGRIFPAPIYTGAFWHVHLTPTVEKKFCLHRGLGGSGINNFA